MTMTTPSSEQTRHHLGEELPEGADVFEGLTGDDHIEGCVGKRKDTGTVEHHVGRRRRVHVGADVPMLGEGEQRSIGTVDVGAAHVEDLEGRARLQERIAEHMALDAPAHAVE